MPFFKGHCTYNTDIHNHRSNQPVYSIDEVRNQTDDGTHVQIQDGRIQVDFRQRQIRHHYHENVPFV